MDLYQGVVAGDGIEPPTIHVESVTYVSKHLTEAAEQAKSSRFPEFFLKFRLS
jgi:hypothetical protein